jgi:hypothetical protein
MAFLRNGLDEACDLLGSEKKGDWADALEIIEDHFQKLKSTENSVADQVSAMNHYIQELSIVRRNLRTEVTPQSRKAAVIALNHAKGSLKKVEHILVDLLDKVKKLE